jgi:OOP family OmpA-OmpF porin
LAGASFDKVTVEGHTDRLGTTAYNQTLSQSRADAVKSHLVAAGRIDAAKVTAVGMGEAGPVTLPDQCKGAASAKVIACLQPDRRVVIEVTGSR